MREIQLQNAQTYASLHNLVGEDKSKTGKTAIKAHEYYEPYIQERRVYQRLRNAEVTEIIGFHVPELIRHDDDLQIIEMTIVTPPFVLDFAGARLDVPPEFSDEVWAQWEAEKEEQFGSRWPEARAVLSALEEYDIYVLDVSPRNITF